jgi:hypothetical protein
LESRAELFRDRIFVVGIGGAEVRGRFLDPFSDFPVTSPPIVVGGTGIVDRAPGIAAATNEGFVVVAWATGRGPAGGSGNDGVMLQIVGADGTLWGEPLQLVEGERNIGGVACGWNGDDVIVIWWRASGDGAFNTMVSQRVQPTFLGPRSGGSASVVPSPRGGARAGDPGRSDGARTAADIRDAPIRSRERYAGPVRAVRLLAVAVVLLTALVARADTLDDAVQRYLSPYAEPSACVAMGAAGGEHRWECRYTECPGGCQVVHLVVVLGERNGTWRRVSERRDRVGDTGECGCCLDGF